MNTSNTLELIIRTTKTGAGEKDAEAGLTSLKKTAGDVTQQLLGVNLADLTLVGGMALLGKAAMDCVAAAGKEELAEAKLGAVLKSTAGAAGMEKDALVDLAQRLSWSTGIDKAVVENAEAVLLTFRNIGEEVFPQTMQAALDMSAVMGGDLQGSLIQIAKAMQDPNTGLTALRRSGVSFNEAQTETIKKLQETGHLMEADKLILAELNAEFGGAAAAMGNTYPGQVAKLNAAIDEMKEGLGAKLLPVLTEASSALALIFTYSDRVKMALKQADQQVLGSAATYEEYRKQIIRNGLAAQGYAGQALELNLQARLQATDVAHVNNEFGILTATQWAAASAALALENANKPLVETINDETRAAELLASRTQQATTEFAALKDQIEAGRASLQAWNQVGVDAGNVMDKYLYPGSQRYLEGLQAIDAATGSSLFNNYQYNKGMEDLFKNFASGKINSDQLETGLASLGETFKKLDPFKTLKDSVDDGITKLQLLAQNFEDLPTVKDMYVYIHTIETGKPAVTNETPSSTWNGPPPSAQTTGSYHAVGADYIVPPGFYADDWVAHASSGERVSITAANAVAGQGAGAAGGGPKVNIEHMTIQDNFDKKAAEDWLGSLV